MTDIVAVWSAVRARLEANAPDGLALRWSNDPPQDLPDVPSPFAFVELHGEPADLAAFGGGRGANVWRQACRIEAHVMVPVGTGMPAALAHAEAVAAVFRSYRDSVMSCFAAWVEPGGADADDGNYFVCSAVIRLHFDQDG